MARRLGRVWIPLAAAIAIAVTGAPLRASGIEALDVAARSGESAPGTGETFDRFFSVSIDDLGRLAFLAGLTGDEAVQQSIWSWDGEGAPVVLACECLDLPGMAGARPQGLHPPLASLRGIAFRATLKHENGVTAANDSCLFGPDGAGNPTLLARVSEPLSGAPEHLVLHLGLPRFDNAGVAVSAILFGPTGAPSHRTAVLVQDAGAGLAPVALSGAPAPGGEYFCGTGDGFVGRNAGGAVSFAIPVGATLEGDVCAPTTDSALFVAEPGGPVERIARTGDPAPGVEGAFSVFAENELDAAGEAAFVARLQLEGAVHAGNDAGIWGPDGAGGLRLVAREGDPAPGTNLPYGNLFFAQIHLNDAGWVLFSAETAPSGRGLWAAAPTGETHLVQAFAEPALTGLALLDEARVAFTTNVGGASALWVHDLTSRRTRRVLRDGDVVDLGAGDTRVLGPVAPGFNGIDIGAEADATGRVGALLRFEDGGSAVARITVPESAAEWAALVALAALAPRARPRRTRQHEAPSSGRGS